MIASQLGTERWGGVSRPSRLSGLGAVEWECFSRSSGWGGVRRSRNPPNQVKTVCTFTCVSLQEGGLSTAFRRLKASGREEGKEMRSFIKNLLVSEKYIEDTLEQKCL